MNEDELFFIAEAVRFGKSLPYCHAVRFFGGMIRSLDEEHWAVTGLRKVIAGDAQLELIQLGRPAQSKRGGRRQ